MLRETMLRETMMLRTLYAALSLSSAATAAFHISHGMVQQVTLASSQEVTNRELYPSQGRVVCVLCLLCMCVAGKVRD